MPPKKWKTAKNQEESDSPASHGKAPSTLRSLKDPSKDGTDRGLLLLPPELHNEILDNFPPIVSQTQLPGNDSVLSRIYLKRTAVLRTLSQVSVSYRHHFLPLLWQVLNICCAGADQGSWYKHLGDTLVRKCEGLSRNPELSSFIR